jgi:type VI secretion system protein ImpC
LSSSDCYKWLVEETVGTPGAEPWSLICGNFTFCPDVDDVAALMRISKVCEIANAPFISHVSPMIFGMNSLSEAKGSSDWKIDEDSVEGKLWETLRVSPESRFLGLAMPRYLARLPYGAATDPTESFSFEELVEVSEHERYVWANPSFVCALLLAQTYRKHGGEMSRNFELNLAGLPTHIFEDEGETTTKPCAEILMTESICQSLLDQGIIPLISHKDSDRVQVGRFQSISVPAKGLAGRWS